MISWSCWANPISKSLRITKNNLIMEIYKNPLVLENSHWSCKYNDYIFPHNITFLMEISQHCADQWFFLLNSYLSASSNTTYSTDVSFKSISIITCRNRPGVATMLPIKQSISKYTGILIFKRAGSIRNQFWHSNYFVLVSLNY